MVTINKELIEQFAKELQTKQLQRQLFWESSLCEQMINDIIKINLSFDDEELSYFPNKVKDRYGWQHISNEDIHLFIDVMADEYIGLEKNYKPLVNNECPFENFTINKKGIEIFIMIGQGTSICLKPKRESNGQ